MRQRRGGSTVTVLKIISITLIVAAVFSIVWLRSNVMSLEYSLSTLEKAKMEALRDGKHMVAQRAGLMSLNRIDRADFSDLGFAFPERKKVVYVASADAQGPRKASYTKP